MNSFFTSTVLIIILIHVSHFTKSQNRIDPKNIDIVRDQWGVPHIYANTDAEAAYGLAWATAEDDFKTVQITLLAAKEMAGEAFGAQGAAADYFMQLIKAREFVSNELSSIPKELLVLLSGYIEGVNAYASTHPKEVILKKAFPVTMEDMLCAYVLSLSSISGATTVVGNLFNDLEQDEDGAWKSSKGSNAIAIQGKITDNGNTFLAINSHQPLEGPDSWYEAHLNSKEGLNILGGTFPGGAMIFHGVNPYLGWAHTVNYPDKVDVFKLTEATGMEDYYFLDGETLPLEVRKIKLKVKVFLGIKIGVKKKAYWSKLGPVIKNKNGYYAVRFGSLMNVSAPLQWYKMNKATNWSEFRKALEICALPGFNIVYADVEDNIFFTSMALLPKRNPEYSWKGVIPGYTSDVIWTDFYGLEELPQILNPNSGYLFNANNTVFNASDPSDNIEQSSINATMGFPTRNNNRAIRFQELLSNKRNISYNDFKRIKFDNKLPDSLHYQIDINPLFDLNPSEYPEIELYLKLLQSWDRQATHESVGATLFKGVIDQLYREELDISESDFLVKAVKNSQKHLEKNFKSIEVPLGEYQRHVRDNFELPMSGIPDVITAMWTKEYKKGKERTHSGESYILLAQFRKGELPEIETINAYGASNHKNNPHHTDQMEMYTKQKLKQMTLDKDLIYRNAESIYHPETK